MNIRQKIYDSNNSGNVLIKIKNSSSLSKNLEIIRNRKPLYLKISSFERKKCKSNLIDYYRKQENLVVYKILEEIRTKEIKPIFTEQSELIKNCKKSRENLYRMYNKEIRQENENFKKRLLNLKPFISARGLDKEYNNSILRRSAKKKASMSLILPPINNRK